MRVEAIASRIWRILRHAVAGEKKQRLKFLAGDLMHVTTAWTEVNEIA